MASSVKARDIKRFNQVFGTILKHEWGSIVKKSGKISDPESVREIIEELGGTFVKLGQFLSLRPDLIPQKYCDELSKLQDSVKPFPFSQAKKIIEKSTGENIDKTFSSFNKKAIASASIGQVYKAKLKTGEDVAVKVRRPDIDELMATDMEILTLIAKQIKKHFSSKVFDPEEVVEELKEYTEHELDFMLESSKIRKFYVLLDGTPVKIPRPFIKMCSEKMIVMEYIEGKKLSDMLKEKIPKPKRKELADNIVNAFFKQIFIDGFFHADPHPGNIIVLDNKKYPKFKIALLDFGITGEINREVKESLVHLFVALIDHDIEHIISAMAELHLIDTRSPDLRKDMIDMLGPYYGASLKQIDVPKLFIQSMKVARNNKVKIPKDYVLLGKSLITLESVCSLVNPDFDFVESAKPFIKRLLLRKFAPITLAKKGFKTLESLKDTLEEIPKLTRQYLKRDIESEKRMEELSTNMLLLEKDIRMIADRFVMFGSSLVLLIASYLFFSHYPPASYALLGLAVIIILISLVPRKN